EQRRLPQLGLSHVPQPPARDSRHEAEVHERAVDGREHERAARGDVLAPFDSEPEPQAAEAEDGGSDGAAQDHARPPRISPTPSSAERPVVSITTASSATASGDVARVESTRSRRAMLAAASS